MNSGKFSAKFYNHRQILNSYCSGYLKTFVKPTVYSISVGIVRHVGNKVDRTTPQNSPLRSWTKYDLVWFWFLSDEINGYIQFDGIWLPSRWYAYTKWQRDWPIRRHWLFSDTKIGGPIKIEFKKRDFSDFNEITKKWGTLSRLFSQVEPCQK